MRSTTSKEYSRAGCQKCSVKFKKLYLTCPFCDELIPGNLPYSIGIFIGIFGIVLVAMTVTLYEIGI